MMDELLDQFLIEGRELIQQASDDLLALDRNHADSTRLDSAFRAFHTLKGSVGLFDLIPMGQALHAAEDLLSAARDDRISMSGTLVGVLLDCIGACEEWVEDFARRGQLSAGADQRSHHLQQALRAHLDAGQPGAVPAPQPNWVAALLGRAPDAAARANGQRLTAMRYVPSADCFLSGDDPLALVRSVPGLLALHVEPREPWADGQIEPFTCNLVIELLCTAPVDEVRRIVRFVADQVVVVEAVSAVGQTSGQPRPARGLRVDPGKVDALVDLVGELIVAKNALAHLARKAAGLDLELGRALSASQADIERLVGDAHRAVMDLRMVPLAQTFRRLPRLVRDLAVRVGKDVRFEMVGEDLDADKTVVDGLFEPLLHILRNAIDHGIEPAADRAAAGKAHTGQVTLTAARQSHQIVISVADDGSGIDPAKVRATAKARRVLEPAALDALSDEAVGELIFAPGFSTAAAITETSGRGVGMDAVRGAVSALGGRITLTSVPAAGTTIRLLLPQTVTVHRVITVQVGDERYGIPMSAIIQIARVAAGAIMIVGPGEAFVLRDSTVPVVRLTALLGHPVGPRPETAKILVIATADGPVGIEVDGLAEQVDVLSRPLTGLLSGMSGFLGAALLGDGSVLMVLDVPALIG
jgi:two-component system chemotaxis sensor kinase CheA